MKNNVSRQETPSIQSLDRGLVILEAVARSADPVSLGELTGLLGIDRSSVFRLANTLRRRAFLSYLPGRKVYILGPSVWRLSHQTTGAPCSSECLAIISNRWQARPKRPRTWRFGKANRPSLSTT